jgi:hypothetical protein
MARYNLGLRCVKTNRGDESEILWRQASVDWRWLANEQPDSSEFVSRLGATLSNLAQLRVMRKQFRDALPLVEEAIEHQTRALTLMPVYELAEEFMNTHRRVLDEINQAIAAPPESGSNSELEIPIK